jgi:hypothetical protein
MRKTIRASVLVLSICGSAFAGDMSTPSTPQPPPPSGITTEEQLKDGAVPPGAIDSFTEILLSTLESALESVLALS